MPLLFLVLLQDPIDDWNDVEEIAKKGEAARESVAKMPDGFWKDAAIAELDARRDAGDAWEPARITLKSEGPARDILRAFAAQAKVGLNVDGAPDRKGTVEIENASWFEALRVLHKTFEIDVQQRRDGLWEIASPSDSRKAVFVHRTFELALVTVTRSTQSNFKEPPFTELVLGLSLRADPVAPLLRVSSLKAVEAVDDTGKSLLLSQARIGITSYRGVAQTDRSAQKCRLSLDAPAEGAKKIPRLRGVLDVSLARRSEAISWENVLEAKDAVKEAGKLKLTLKRVTPRGQEFDVEVDVASDANIADWPETMSFRLADSAGTLYQHWGSSSSRGGTKGSYRITFRNPGQAGDPASLTVPLTTETYSRKLYFELKDVPLP